MLHTDNMILLSLTVLSLLFSLSAIVVAERISYYTFESVEAGESLTLCNCVVFRMDDIQDVFVDKAQIAAMNLFISKDQSCRWAS